MKSPMLIFFVLGASPLLMEGALTMTVSGRVISDTTNTGLVELGDEVDFKFTFNEHKDAGLEFAIFLDTANYWIADSAWDNPDTTDFVEGVSVWTRVESSILTGTLSNGDSTFEPREAFVVQQETDLLGTTRTKVIFDLTSEMDDTGYMLGDQKVVSVGGTVFTTALSFSYPGAPVVLKDWIDQHKGDYTVDMDGSLYDSMIVATTEGILTLDPVGSWSGTRTADDELITWMGFTADANGFMDTGEFMGTLYVGEYPNIYSYDLQSWFYAPSIESEPVGPSTEAYIFIYRPGS